MLLTIRLVKDQSRFSISDQTGAVDYIFLKKYTLPKSNLSVTDYHRNRQKIQLN